MPGPVTTVPGRHRHWKRRRLPSGPGRGSAGLDFFTDCGHDGLQQAHFFQQADGFVRRQAVVDLLGHLTGSAGKNRFQGQQRRPAIGIARMGIHDALGDFDQFSDVSDEKDVGKAFIGGVVEGFADIIADSHARTDVEAQMVPAEIDAVIAEKSQ